MNNTKPNRLAVKLTVTGERSVRSGHPWIFSDSIEKINIKGIAGDIAIIFSHTKNKVIGVGLYDPDSPIRIKMLHHGGATRIDVAYFLEKIQAAYALRVPLLNTNTNSYRLLFGENDGFPGFIADVYNLVLVVKLYSEIWMPYLDEILKILQNVTKCECTVVRLSRKLQKSKTSKLKDGDILFGTLTNEVVKFIEHGVYFSANVIKGHKTGYFLDHRANRKLVGDLSRGKDVLDVFSYAGGFSVHALAKGAKEVTSLDISKQALEVALLNGKLNDYSGVHKTIAGDAFDEMHTLIAKKKSFDIVVIDPPSFAKNLKEIAVAKKKYTQLALLGERLCKKGGMLILASCSSRISSETFFDINKDALTSRSRNFSIHLTTGHDIDHPIGFPEGAYLKCGYYKLD
jgi:23S rRNA (cytosine1962-C5)-methyltransferase